MEESGRLAWEAALRQPGELVRGAGASSFTAHLDRWVAEARVDEAALRRARERWLQEVAEQEATLAGVLADLAERGGPLTLHGRGARRHHGRLRLLGLDFVVVGLPSGTDVLMVIDSLTSVRTAPAVELAIGDENGPIRRDADGIRRDADGNIAIGLRVHDVLAELAADRERVVLVTADGETLTGQLRSVGHDVAVLRTDAEPRATAYVALAAVAEVVLA